LENTRGFIIGVALTCLDSEHDLLSVKKFFWQPTAVTNDHLFIASTNFTIMIQPDLNPLDSKPLRFVDFGPPVSTAVSSIKMAWLSGTKDFKCGNCQLLDYHVKGWGRNLLTRETPTPFLHPRDGPWYGEGIWDPVMKVEGELRSNKVGPYQFNSHASIWSQLCCWEAYPRKKKHTQCHNTADGRHSEPVW